MYEIHRLGVYDGLCHRRISFIGDLKLSQNRSLCSPLFVFVHVVEETAAVLVHGVDLVPEPLYLLVHPMDCFPPVYLRIDGILDPLQSFLFVMERNEFARILIGHLSHPLVSGPQKACDIVRNEFGLRYFIQSLSVCNTLSLLMVGIESWCVWLTSRRADPGRFIL